MYGHINEEEVLFPYAEEDCKLEIAADWTKADKIFFTIFGNYYKVPLYTSLYGDQRFFVTLKLRNGGQGKLRVILIELKLGTQSLPTYVNTKRRLNTNFKKLLLWQQFSNTVFLLCFFTLSSVLMHGRRIARSLWEYFKVTNVIVASGTTTTAAADESAASAFRATAANFGSLNLSRSQASAPSHKESAFSMLRLRWDRYIYNSILSVYVVRKASAPNIFFKHEILCLSAQNAPLSQIKGIVQVCP